MSDVIKLLPDSVANQIAAGEVIQRPSSVIKELVENAIDAGATKVQIIVKEAGKESIQVIDNGKGMSDTDARLAFERHATSKIKEASDLFSLQTKGFRGEALASIAAVAQVTLKTKQQGNEIGTCIVIEGSKVKEQAATTCPVGSNFLINNLFFNIPARRKFLKSNQSELNQIMTEFERVALAHPEIEFDLYSGSNLLQHLPIGSFKQRILNLFGKKMDAQLVPIKVETDIINISGFVGTPKNAKKKGSHQFFFVNDRFIKHPYFNRAIQSAFERFIAEGEQVSYFIKLDVPPAHIDVNIHPGKTEVKFQHEQEIWPILLATVRESIGKNDIAPTIDFDTDNLPEIPTFTGNFDTVQPPVIGVDARFNPFDNPSSGFHKASSFSPSIKHKADTNSLEWKDMYDGLLGPENIEGHEKISADGPTLFDEVSAHEKQIWNQTDIACLQYQGHYIIATTTEGLIYVDQHRAHMRILYDEYIQRIENHKSVSQRLLFPQVLQFAQAETVILDSLEEDLQKVGFELSPLGGGSYSVLGIPAGTEGVDLEQMLRGIIEDARYGEVSIKEQVLHIIANQLAQHSAMPVGQYLSETEMKDLLVRLFHCNSPKLTPDGKVIYVSINGDDIDKMFA